MKVNLFKLIPNSCFGKFIENIRKRVDLNLFDRNIEKENKTYRKYISKPTYKGLTDFGDMVYALENRKQKILLNKPIFVGCSILELSKWFMYDFYYNTLKKKYGDKLKLLGTDTDSLIYYVETNDIFEDMKQYKDVMDFSDYPKDHTLFNMDNCKKLGKFKDELNSKQIEEVIFLKSKCYYIKCNQVEKKVCKGVKKSVIKNELSKDDYKSCVEGINIIQKNMNLIRSDKHQLYSINVSKTAMNSIDYKIYLLNGGINTLAYGHYKIN